MTVLHCMELVREGRDRKFVICPAIDCPMGWSTLAAFQMPTCAPSLNDPCYEQNQVVENGQSCKIDEPRVTCSSKDTLGTVQHVKGKVCASLNARPPHVNNTPLDMSGIRRTTIHLLRRDRCSTSGDAHVGDHSEVAKISHAYTRKSTLQFSESIARYLLYGLTRHGTMVSYRVSTSNSAGSMTRRPMTSRTRKSCLKFPKLSG